eukprot:10952688-Alexandrium_andersonii.AAC.2
MRSLEQLAPLKKQRARSWRGQRWQGASRWPTHLGPHPQAKPSARPAGNVGQAGPKPADHLLGNSRVLDELLRPTSFAASWRHVEVASEAARQRLEPPPAS